MDMDTVCIIEKVNESLSVPVDPWFVTYNSNTKLISNMSIKVTKKYNAEPVLSESDHLSLDNREQSCVPLSISVIRRLEPGVHRADCRFAPGRFQGFPCALLSDKSMSRIRKIRVIVLEH